MSVSTVFPPRTISRRTETRVRSSGRDEFSDVTDMFRVLSGLDEESPAFRRQRDAIVRRCLPLADNIARRFRDRGEAHDDLVQVARVGLMNAVNRFDVSSGSEFIAFAVPTMMGEVRRHFRDHGWALKVPRRLKELNLTLKSASKRTGSTAQPSSHGQRACGPPRPRS